MAELGLGYCRSAWQNWDLVTATCVLRGRRHPAQPLCHIHLSHTIFVRHCLSHITLSHTIFHPQLCHTPSFTTPSFAHNFVTHHLSPHHLSHTILSHTIFHTHNFVTRSLSHTPFFTHNFVTRSLSHTTFTHTIFHIQLCHTQLCFTCRSSTTSFVFPSFPVPATTFGSHYWKKLPCGVIRSFASGNHRSFDTEKPLRRESFALRSFYTHKLFHRSFYTEKLLSTGAFTHRCLYTQKLVHTEACTHRSFYTEKPFFTHRRFPKEKPIPQSSFYTLQKIAVLRKFLTFGHHIVRKGYIRRGKIAIFDLIKSQFYTSFISRKTVLPDLSKWITSQFYTNG